MTYDTVELTTDMVQNGEHQELYEEYAKKKAESLNARKDGIWNR